MPEFMQPGNGESNETTIAMIISTEGEYLFDTLHKALKQLPGLALVAEKRDLSEAVRLVQLMEPNVMLVDVKNAGTIGRELIRQVLDKNPAISVLSVRGDGNSH